MKTKPVEGNESELEQVFNGKPKGAFRDYSIDDNDPIKARVRKTYKEMHTNVTVDLVNRKKKAKWLKFNTAKMTIKEALIKLNDLVDQSDPDIDVPNIMHAFQTAERIRAAGGEDWYQLTGLIHDLGKVMAFYDEPQYCVVGDTFPLGCKWADSIVYGPESFKDNPDTYNPKYNTKYGIYEPNCGLDNVLISWSHDEYLYQFLLHNKAKIPEKGLYVIRYHSLSPWYVHGDYRHLANEKDEEMLPSLIEFHKFDLYTKSAANPDIEALWPYYEKLIDKYIPGVCEF